MWSRGARRSVGGVSLVRAFAKGCGPRGVAGRNRLVSYDTRADIPTNKLGRVATFALCGAFSCAALVVGEESRAEESREQEEQGKQGNNSQVLFNWSATQSCLPKRVLRPEDQEEVAAALEKHATDGKKKLRIMGSGLSPNGLAFSDETLLTLENMRRVISVDQKKLQVTVQAGILVGELLEELAEHGLTLQNLASINSQQIGGFTQAGAHGTGSSLPPVEEQVVAMTVVTPGLGTVELSASKSPEWFRLAKVGLGCFGVVTQLTLQCVPAHKLVEKTQVMTRAQIRDGHVERLKQNRHVRYMWLPYTGSAVVVTSNPASPGNDQEKQQQSNEKSLKLETQPLIDLLQSSQPSEYNGVDLSRRGFGELRDMLIAASPHSRQHIEKVNQAELQFWRNSETLKAEPEDSSSVLAFDCGGQQLVLETAFPCGTLDKPNLRDLDFMDALLEAVEENPSIAAPAPIEQRWSCGSSAAMSPAHCAKDPESALFSWVGIIMYLPTAEEKARQRIQASFQDYANLLMDVDKVGGFGVKTHWAKIQIPHTPEEIDALRAKLQSQYPLAEWNKARALFDPTQALSNDLVDTLLSEKF